MILSDRIAIIEAIVVTVGIAAIAFILAVGLPA